MKKRWFVVVLTIGLLLSVLPLSVLALSPDPTITDADGNILGWSDLSTVPYSLDDLQEQRLAVVDEKPGTAAAPGLWETGPEKSLADADSKRFAVVDAKSGTAAAPGLSETGLENSLADEDSDEATDGPSAANQPLDGGSEDDDPADNPDSTTTSVCKIGEETYSTLDEAISKAKVGDQIDLLRDIEVNNTGLTFDGKTLTISGGGTRTLTLNGIGIYARGSNITFENLTLHIYAHIHPNQNGGAANLITSTNLRLDDVDFELISDKPNEYGAGLYMERGSNLYLDNGTSAVIRNFNSHDENGNGASGIYAEQTNTDLNEGNIEINSSYLEVTGCYHAGLLIDPLDLTLTSSEVVLEKNGCDGYGFGLACYDGIVTLNSSTITATENGGDYQSFGVFAGVLDVDGYSTLNAFDNGGSGLGVGGKSWIRSGAKVFCERNGVNDIGGAGGLVVYAEHSRSIYEGDLTIESGAYVYACNNVGLAGLLNDWILNIENGATVIVDGNSYFGFANSYDARATIKNGANVSANNNYHGIYNYAGAGDQKVVKEGGFFLIEGGAHVTANNNKSCGICNTVDDRIYGNTGSENYYTPEDDCFTIEGGADVSADGNGVYGIYNEGGIFTIENGANISTCHNYHGIFNDKHGTFTIENGANISTCNNSHDGIYNTNSGTFTMETGANVSVCNNSRYGIFNNKGTFTVENGVDLQVEYNKESGVVNVENSKLTLLSGCVRYNTTNNLYGYGGGLRNYGEATLSNDVQLYNNHAAIGGDDIENGEYATITFGPTGKGWELDGAPDCYDFIDGWYDDYKTTRWNAHEENGAKLHMVLVAPVTSYTGPLSLKAAHGALSTGSLTVRKELIGDLLSSDYDTEFTFELTLDDDTITTIDDQWCGVPFQNGKASFTLKGGESITISNLPAGVGYTVTEAAQSNWIQLNVSGGADIGVVPRNDIAEIVFTNQKIGVDFPDVPLLPIEPEEPEIPEIPEEPEKPQTPDVPEEPKGPETPKETETLQETEAPAQDQTPGELPAEEPAQADTAVPTQPVETPTQNTTAETLIQTGTTDWLAAVLMFSGFGLLVCGWFFNRKQRAKKH